jgi:hypothetical protein
MKKIIILFLLVPGLCSLFAQQNQERRDEASLQQAISQLAAANELLRTFPNDAAAALLLQADKMIQESKLLLAQNASHLAQARLKLALDLIRQATGMLSTIPLQRAREQLEELIRRAEQVIPGSGDKEAERLLNRARENQRSGKSAIAALQFQKGLELMRVGRLLVERALSLVDGHGDSGQDQLTEERERFTELFEKTQNIVANCHKEQASKILLQAQRQAETIDQKLAHGNYQLALGLYYNATRLLLRALDICQGNALSEKEQVLEDLEHVSDMLKNAQEHAQNARDLLIVDRASLLYFRARTAADEDQPDLASRQLDLSKILLSRLLSRDHLSDQVQQEIDRLQEGIAQKKADAALNAQPGHAVLLQAAEKSLAQAQRCSSDGKIRAALAAVLSGNRLLDLCAVTNANPAQASPEKLEADLARLQDEIAKAPALMDEQGKDLLDLAAQLADRGRSALAQQNYALAESFVNISFELLGKALNR